MATPATLTISSTNIVAGAVEFQIGPLSVSVASPSPQINGLTFASGTFLSTTGPTGATYCVIQPPSANTVQLTLKGITGDTGIPISASNPTLVSFFNPATTNTIGLTSAAAISGSVTLTWF